MSRIKKGTRLLPHHRTFCMENKQFKNNKLESYFNNKTFFLNAFLFFVRLATKRAVYLQCS